MHIELIMTGEELLDGRVVNSNESEIAGRLLRRGFRVLRSTTVGDDPQRLKQVFAEVQARADIAIVTGGLGPTDDDRTVAILADLAQVPIRREPALVETLRAYFAALQRPLGESNLKQADLPEGARSLLNPNGTAPGVDITIGHCRFFAMPGVPSEMKAMLEDSVIPCLIEQAGPAHAKPFVREIKCFGLGESKAADLLADLYPLPEGLEIGYRAALPEIHIRLQTNINDAQSAEQIGSTYAQHVQDRLAPYIFGYDEDNFVELLAQLFRQQNKTLALAESCTGGLIARQITALAGSSDYFLCSAVTYSNASKSRILGVPEALLQEHGAVSEAVARAMAEGALRISGADIAVAVTGIAGPEGGTSEKPVGTVDIAAATVEKTWHRRFFFPGQRHRVQMITAYTALNMARRILLGLSPVQFETQEKKRA